MDIRIRKMKVQKALHMHLNYYGMLILYNMQKIIRKFEKELMARRGIEPVTFALLARRSNQLS